MAHSRTCWLVILAVAASGCRSFGPLVKRDSEMNCPTDIRRTVPWCYGEDAVFQCPCGPSEDFYGHKPTCWRCWPAPATQWRNAYCGCPPVCPPDAPGCIVGGEMMALPPTEEQVEPVPAFQAPGAEAPPVIEALPPMSKTRSHLDEYLRRAARLEAVAEPRSAAAVAPAVAVADSSHDGNVELADVPTEAAAYAADGAASSTMEIVPLPASEAPRVEPAPSVKFLRAVRRAARTEP